MSKFRFYKSEHTEYVIVNDTAVCFDEHCHSCDFIITIITYGNVVLSQNGIDRTIHTNELFKIAPYETHALFSDFPITAVTMCIRKDLVFSDNIDNYKQHIEDSLFEFTKYSNDLDFSEDLSNMFHKAAL